ncbi:DUF2730 family protein [Falsiroseomonas sp.]|uniref:DUF2730 family protein n=1 Tax=Falsiroseomonas sp. TaxID=2870721 RepID=UPI002728B78F|nr:DUF2730 family protein [Falsiroseomonas sp.]MDO9499023.1 DUF2730 family protein [Falsiroseomonas sp.]
MNLPETWLRDLVLLLSAAGVIGGVVIAWIRLRLSGDFAGKADITALGNKINELEAKLNSVPTHDDVRRLGDRLSAMESGLATVGAEVRGMREGINRVERDLHLLLQHELAKQKAPGS